MMQVRYIKHSINGSDVNSNSHFIEIQAFESGVNVALNKTITCDIPASGLSAPIECVVDGEYTVAHEDTYYNVEEPNPTITIDLGQEYNIDIIKVWHYHTDGRKYKDNKVSVSRDGYYYKEQFNSNIDGEYAETVSGKEIVVDKAYEAYVKPSLVEGGILMEVVPNGMRAKYVDVMLANKLVGTYSYDGNDIIHTIKDGELAFGKNKYKITLMYDVWQYDTSIEKEYNVANIPNNETLVDTANHVDSLVSTIERDCNDLLEALINKDVVVTEEDKMSTLISKVNDIELGKKWASGTATSALSGSTKASITVSANFGFIPSVVIIRSKNTDLEYAGTFYGIYSKDIGNQAKCQCYNYLVYNVGEHGTWVSENGFCLLVHYQSASGYIFDWIAFE